MIYESYLLTEIGEVKIEINCRNTVGETKQLMLAAGGCKLTLNGDDDIFKPIKSCAASLTFVTEEDLSPLYQGHAQENVVKIGVVDENGSFNKLLFCGYVTPCQLSQPIDNKLHSVQIECVDVLSVLQWIDFEAPEASQGNGLIKISDLINEALRLGAAGNFEIAQSFCSPLNYKLSELYVQVDNFFDEKDEAMKYSTVLEEVLKFLNLQLTIQGDKASIYDVRQLKSDSRTTENGENISSPLMAVDDLKFIDEISTSLTDVVDKVKVSVSLYSDKSALPELFNDKAEPNRLANSYGATCIEYNKEKDTRVRDYFTFYHQDGVTLRRENVNNHLTESANYETSIERTYNHIGAYMVKRTSIDWKNSENQNNTIINDSSSDKSILICRAASYCAVEGKEVPSWLNHGIFVVKERPLITIEDSVSRTYASDYYLVLSGTVRYLTTKEPMIGGLQGTKLDDYKEYERAKENFAGKPFFGAGVPLTQSSAIPFRLKIGDKYLHENNLYNVAEGENPNREEGQSYVAGQWNEESYWSMAYVSPDDTLRYHLSLDRDLSKRVGEFEWLNKDFKIRNNVEWTDGLEGAKGLKIPIKASDMLSGKLTLEIGIPGSPVGGFTQWVILTDLKIGLYRKKNQGDLQDILQDSSDDDVEYENIIDLENVKEGQEISLKVATDVGRDFSKGSVLVEQNGVLSYLQDVTSSITNKAQKQECHIIESRVEQFKEPKEVLEGTAKKIVLDWTSGASSAGRGKKYVINKASVDLDAGRTNLTLIEL